MKTPHTILFFALASLVLAGACTSTPSGKEEEAAVAAAPAKEVSATAEEIPEAVRQRLREATVDFGGALKAVLVKELSEKGPAAAIDVCSQVAPKLALEKSSDQLVLRRISFKARHPGDAPTDFEAEYLARLEQLHVEGQPAEELFVPIEEGERRGVHYFKPIVVEAACLLCHGPSESLDPQVRRILDERYPQDHARGYMLGDFRGAFSTRLYFDE
ncbi:MAG: DUF3365 domain-containing protein [Acidobacteriota bacterium]|nr:DUF3365 domain-containing protein [Acidobacteriota bacterium]